MMGLCTFTACSSSNDDDKKDDPKEIVIQDAEYDAIINQYVDNVVMPTYRDLKERNSDLYLSVVDFGNAPSDAKFQAICDAWLAAREPWEQSEAFLFGPVADFGLDPNMDSWPLDQEAIVNTLKSQQWNDMTWSGDYDEDDEAIAAAQNVRGFHTLEFLAFRDGKARTLSDAAASSTAADYVYDASNATAWAQYMRNTAQLLVDDVTLLCSEWEDSYANTFKKHNGGDFTSGLSCIEQLIDGCIDIAGEVGGAKIGEPYDLYMSGAYYGSRDGSIHNNSLSKLVAKYDQALDQKVKQAIDLAAKTIQAIPQPFRNNINSAEAQKAMEACAELAEVLENDLKPFLQNNTK